MLKSIKQTNLQTAIQYSHDNVVTLRTLLSTRAKKQSLASGKSLKEFQSLTGLRDLYWQTLYFKYPDYDQGLAQAIADADGYVFFLHGWTGNHRIWEDMPGWLTSHHKNIVCFNLDVNGFGASPFIAETPTSEQCTPPAIIKAVEYWLEAIQLWPATATRRRRPFFLFIGHSMSGAALFYKDVSHWQDYVYGFYSLAPALFHNDAQRKTFFKTVGVSIGLPTLAAVKDALAPRAIDILGPGASQPVKTEHLRVYNETPFGTLAQTMYALGSAPPPPNRTDWGRFRVALGHKDRVVTLESSLNLFEELHFSPAQLRVTLGDHYFFSFGEGSPATHHLNRQVLKNDLLMLCHRLTQESRK
jgi:pimeloyl-ACP methyl ester carboxylesterase